MEPTFETAGYRQVVVIEGNGCTTQPGILTSGRSGAPLPVAI